MKWLTVSLDTRVKRGGSIEWTLIEDKAVLVNTEDGIVLKLDEVGTAVWTAIDDPCAVASIVKSVCDTYDVDKETARKDILRLLAYLKSNEAIEYTNEGGKKRWNFFKNGSGSPQK